METQTQNLTRAFDKMPNEFSSNKFITIAKKYGISDYEVINGHIVRFLKERCNRRGKRTWIKKSTSISIESFLNEHSCINFLKSTGKYKIQTLTQTWTEI